MPQELKDVATDVRFPTQEEEILDLWQRIDAFQTSLKKSEGRPEYTFYDGPPFATGLPHYGHLLAGTIKDIVTRYATQTGHHVERRFGWDCHGLPIEFEIEKKLGIKTREQVLAMGIDNYNEECRSIVMRYSSEWRRVVNRMGRWIDFDNDYKTMNVEFMESVWWVIKQLFDKGLIYRGFKVMPFSTGCTTALSNFEANMNYKEVQDPAVMVSFPLVEDPQVKLIAWTTTPWTLPSNLALCLNPDFDYVKIQDNETQNIYVVAECRLTELYKPRKGAADQPPQYTVLDRFKGSQLAGKHYVPLFNYFVSEDHKNRFLIITDDYVTSDSGTGVVHCAPGFGEDDFRVCMKWDVIKKGDSVPCPLDLNGRFTSEVPDYQGMFCKDTDKLILKHLKENGRLIHQSTIVHSYPFCWRSDSPLIYRAIPSWFIAVEQFKDRLLKNNKDSYWVPDWVQEKRFHNWLENAIDWAISRNRYWGTPLPLWVSDDFEEVVCVGSVAELEELSGVKGITDLHRHKIDHITIPSRKGKGLLRRVEEVADCWLESGSMPYAQVHYPFENKERFEKSFPADFIAEGIDQTRGWFYTLLVLGTALFDKCPFKNLIVNGLVLAKDGKKMSKSLRNYPDPNDVIRTHGADALRLYLINSPIVRGENLRFNEDGVRDIVRDVFLPWFNAYRFFVQNVIRFNNKSNGGQFVPIADLTPTNVMDRWILSTTHSLIKFVRAEMDAYHLYTVVPRLLQFINQLTNWYVRLNRKRLKGSGISTEEWVIALSTLFHVIMVLVRLMAPFTPFLTEAMYQNLKALTTDPEDSVHYLLLPEPNDKFMDVQIEESVANMQMVIEMTRSTRDKRRVGLKTPLPRVTVIHKDPRFSQDVLSLKDYIVDELNIKQLEVTSDEGSYVTKSFIPDPKLLGAKYKKDFKLIGDALRKCTTEQVNQFEEQGYIDVLDGKFRILAEELKVNRQFKGDMKNFESVSNETGVLILVDYNLDATLLNEGLAREVVNRVQHLRKQAGLNPEDKIRVYYSDSALTPVIESMLPYINSNLNVVSGLRPLSQKKDDESLIIHDNEVKIGDVVFALHIAHA